MSIGVGAWIRSSQRAARASARLFCFPCAGGGAENFRGWAAELPEFLDVSAIQPPGRGARFREPLVDRIGEWLDSLEAAIAPELDRPFAFFGHSVGALTAFELTRRLRRAGRPLPARLFVAGRRAPHLPSRRPRLHALPREQLLAELRSLNGTPPEVLAHEELMDLLLPILRADFSLDATHVYLPEPPLERPITAFWGDADPLADEAQTRAWSEHTTAGLSLHGFAGDHFFVNVPSVRSAMLQTIAEQLAADWQGVREGQ